MDLKEVEKNTIFLFMRGSQAYGTNIATSDIDVGGVCLPSMEVILGVDSFEVMDEWVDENGEKTDKSIYSLDKFFKMATECNPNILDFLFAPDRCLMQTSDIWEEIKANRHIFLSKKCKASFQGYAISQLRRIETHRGYLLNPPIKPERINFNLPPISVFPETQYEVIARIASEWVDEKSKEAFYDDMSRFLDHEAVIVFKKYISAETHRFAIEDFKRRQKEWLRMFTSIKPNFLKEEFQDMAQQELKYLVAKKNWESYVSWEKNRNEKRKELEKIAGFDTKHASHLIRLLRMCCEILEGKGILVDRTNIDAKELISIRNGEFTFKQVLEMAEELNFKADSLHSVCTLPDEPDRKAINNLQMKILKNHIKKEME